MMCFMKPLEYYAFIVPGPRKEHFRETLEHKILKTVQKNSTPFQANLHEYPSYLRHACAMLNCEKNMPF